MESESPIDIVQQAIYAHTDRNPADGDVVVSSMAVALATLGPQGLDASVRIAGGLDPGSTTRFGWPASMPCAA